MPTHDGWMCPVRTKEPAEAQVQGRLASAARSLCAGRDLTLASSPPYRG